MTGLFWAGLVTNRMIQIKKKSELNPNSGLEAGSKAASMASYVLAGKIFTFLMIGIALVLVTRLLGPTQYGVYTLAVAFAGIFGSIGYFGIGTALNKFISEYKQKKNNAEISVLFSNGIFLVVISGIVLTAICFELSGLISEYIFHTAAMSYIIKVVSFWIIAAMLFGTIYDSMLGLGSGRDITVVASIQSFFQASISIALAFIGYGALAPIYGLVLGYFIGFFAGLFIVFRMNGLVLCMPTIKNMRKLLGFSLPVATANIFGSMVGSFGLLLLGYLTVNTAVVGNIGIATRAGSMMSIIFDSISFAMLPAFSAALVNKKLKTQMGRIYGYTVYAAILVVSPLLFYMAIFSTPFSYTLFGGSYSYAPLYISILSIGLLLGIAGAYANTLMISMGKTSEALKYNSIAYVVVVLLFLLFIPTMGGLGYTVVSFVMMPLIIDGIFITKLRTMLEINLRARKLLGIMVANGVVSLIALLFYSFFSGIALLAAAGVAFIVLYPLAVVIAGGADVGDISTIKSLSEGIPFVGSVVAGLAEYASMMIR